MSDVIKSRKTSGDSASFSEAETAPSATDGLRALCAKGARTTGRFVWPLVASLHLKTSSVHLVFTLL